MSTPKTIDQILLELRSISDNMGVYPASMRGFGEETDYEQRDGYKNGWNACYSDFFERVDKILDSAGKEWDSNSRLFAADEEYSFRWANGQWHVILNDTWYYACADGEEISKEQEEEVAGYYRQFGCAGVLYWVHLQRKSLPEIPRYRTMVQGVINFFALNPKKSPTND